MTQSHAELEQSLLACSACPLQRTAIGPTSCNGSPQSPLMLIGEGPGGVEDQYGTPLVGPSGQLLDKALASVKVSRDRIYTTNILKCRPQGNRTPTLEEAKFCASRWLDQEIALVQPQVIIALGSVALKYLKGPDARITRDRGVWFGTKYGMEAIATYHPAYLLRLSGNELVKAKWEVYYDLKAAVERISALSPTYELLSPEPPNLIALYEPRRAERSRRGNGDARR